MLSGFKTRKPWAAATIGIVFGPVAGMLYVNRGRIALCYLGLLFLLAAAVFGAAHFQILTVDPRRVTSMLNGVLQIVGAVHGYWIAKNRQLGMLRWYSRWYSIICLCLLLPLSVAGIFRHAFYEPFHSGNISMEPAIGPDDYFYVEKRAYDNHPPQRGDVVVFKVRLLSGVVEFIKRIIGMPGEKIQIKNGIVYINDKLVQRRIMQERDSSPVEVEETLPEGRKIIIFEDKDKNPPNPADDGIIYNVPADQYFVMGDYPDQSSDSRNALGYIGRPFIVGKAGAVFWNVKTFRFLYRPVE